MRSSLTRVPPRVGGWQLARSKDKLDCCFEPDFIFQSSLQQELLHSSRRARHLEEPSVIVELSHELTHARRRAPTHVHVVLLHRLLVERTVVHSRGCADADAVHHCVKLQHDYGWRTARRRPRRGGKNESPQERKKKGGRKKDAPVFFPNASKKFGVWNFRVCDEDPYLMMDELTTSLWRHACRVFRRRPLKQFNVQTVLIFELGNFSGECRASLRHVHTLFLVKLDN